jgi:hypothetical protein
MKKLFALLFFVTLTMASFAQSTTPRYGIAKNQDNTGNTITLGYKAITDATGADSVSIYPGFYQNNYRVTLVDSLCFKLGTLGGSYAGDNIKIIASGASGTIVKFTGANFLTSGKATLSTNGRAVIDLVFDGAYWVEANRTIQ